MEIFAKLNEAAGDPAENMATDDAMRAIDDPQIAGCLRFYQWQSPALSIGYSQASGAVAGLPNASKKAWVRRPTGGGLVEHGHDQTWAMAIFASSRHFRSPSIELYRLLHAAIAESFCQLGIEAALAPCLACTDTQTHPAASATTVSSPPDIALSRSALSACFTEPVGYDVLHVPTGRKLAGAAMKRNRRAILIQGSIVWPDTKTSNFTQLREVLNTAWQKDLGFRSVPLADQPNPERVKSLRQRYQSNDWNYQR